MYFSSADYNPAEPGHPSLLNDFAKISVTRDAFLMFYDEFPLLPSSLPGFGGGIFNGAQDSRSSKSALEQGLRIFAGQWAAEPRGDGGEREHGPDPHPGRDLRPRQCAAPGRHHLLGGGDPGAAGCGPVRQRHGGTGFMLGSLDFYGFVPLPTSGDNRIAAWAWTGLSALNGKGCATCSASIRFSGQLFSGVDRYYDPEATTNGFPASVGPQKTGPIPLGDDCSVRPEHGWPLPGGGYQLQRRLHDTGLAGPRSALGRHRHPIAQTYTRANAEIHQGAVYWVVGTRSFDQTGTFTLTNQAYVTAMHEDLEFPSIAAKAPAVTGRPSWTSR